MIINDMPSNQDKAFALSYLAFYASESNPKATLPWLNEAMNISTKINNDKLWYWVYARYANTLSILGQTEEALQYYQISNQHAVKASYEWGRVQNLTHIANIYFSWGNYEKAFEYAYANLQAREDKETNFGLGFAHYHLGYLYYNIEDYPEAFYHFSKAATIYKEINLNEYAGLMIQEKAKILVAQNKLDSALVLSGQAMKLFEQSEDKSFKGKLHRDIGNIYFLKEDYTLALSNFFTAESVAINYDKHHENIKANESIGDTYLRLKEFEKAEKYYKNTLNLIESHGRKSLLSAAYSKLANLYLLKTDFKKAIQFANLANEYAKENKQENEQVKNLEILLKSHLGLNDFNHSIATQQELSILSKKVQKELQNKNLTQLKLSSQLRYQKDTLEKEKHLAVKEKQKGKQISTILMLVFSISTFSLFLFIYYVRKRNKVLAEKNKEIAQLHKNLESKALTDRITAETALNKSQKELEYRANFESLLANISSGFLNLSLEKIDAAILDALQQVCQFTNYDRIFVVLFSGKDNTLSVHYEWCKDGIKPLKTDFQNLPIDSSSWLLNRIKNKNYVLVNNRNDLTKETGTLKQTLKTQNLQSIILTPIIWEEESIGYIGFGSEKEQKFHSSNLDFLLRFTGEMIGSVLQRKTNETALKKSAQQLSLIYNNNADFIGLLSINSKNTFIIESVNRSLKNLVHGMTKDIIDGEMIGMEIGILFSVFFNDSQEEIKKRRQFLNQAVNEKREIIFQDKVFSPLEKEIQTFETTLSPILENGRCLQILYVAKNITEKEKAKEALIISKKKMTTIYNSSQDLIGLIRFNDNNQSYEVESINQSAIDFLTKIKFLNSIEDIQGKNVRVFFGKIFNHPDDVVDERVNMIEQVFNDKKIIKYQNSVYSPQKKSSFYFETILSPIVDINGKCTYVLLSSRNITESEIAKNKLISNEKHLKSIFDGSTDQMIIFTVKPNGKLLFKDTNKSFKDAWERANYPIDLKLVYGKSLAFYLKNILGLSKEKTQKHLKMCEIVVSDKKTINFEGNYLMMNNRKYFLDITITPILNEENLCNKVLVVIRDNTIKHRAKEEMIFKILETEDRERSRFAKELHDSLGQNLSAASLTFNQVKKNITGLPPDTKKSFETGIKFLKEAIDESRNIAHNLMPQAISDFGYILAVESLLEDLAQTTDIKFTFYNNLKSNRLSEDFELSLYRITQEAIHNILKHSEASEVTIQLIKHTESIILSIEDNGKGFDRNMAKKTSFGFDSMKARTSALSGVIDIDGFPDKGVSITVEIPSSTTSPNSIGKTPKSFN